MHHASPGDRQDLILDIILAHLGQGNRHGVVVFVRIVELGKVSNHFLDLVFCRLALLFWKQNRFDLVVEATTTEACDRGRILVRAVRCRTPNSNRGG